jgi:hypothetical protein
MMLLFSLSEQLANQPFVWAIGETIFRAEGVTDIFRQQQAGLVIYNASPFYKNSENVFIT